MKIPLVGGPYDANVFDINVDRNGMPELEVLYLPRLTTIEEGRIELLSDTPMAPVKDLRYQLVRVNGQEWINGRFCDSPTKWCWGYRYEG